MKDPKNRSRTLVLAAVAVVVLLASILGGRFLSREKKLPPDPPVARLALCVASAPDAHVPAPKSIASLKVPNWGSQASDTWPIRFQTDLDLLAPLGDGAGNAALWLKDFTPKVGRRESDFTKPAENRVDASGDLGKIFSADALLLKEAEPWADQATMQFYPGIFPMEGFTTRIPNLLMSLRLAKSWVARAQANPDSPAAIEDCRRAIRWGRLLRQDDAILIQDLIGLACIRIGAEGLYDLAARRGDQPLMLATAIVLGESAPQRLKSAQLVTRLSVQGADSMWDMAVHSGVTVSDEKLKEIIRLAKGSKDRRFRAEAITQLALVNAYGTSAQRADAKKALAEQAVSPDPIVSALARWAEDARRIKKEMSTG